MNISVLCEKEEIKTALLQHYNGQVHFYEAVFPHVFREKDAEKAEELLNAPEVLIRTPDELGFLKQKNYAGRIVSDTWLYACNKEALSVLHDLGTAMDTAPFELTCHELSERDISSSELVIYGRIPMMVTSQCMYRNSHKDRCIRGKGENEIQSVLLRDRKGAELPCLCYCRYCYNVIYNSVPLSLHTEKEMIKRLHPASLRLYFTTEKAEEACRITEFFLRLFSEEQGGAENPEPPFKDYTKGHFRKGIE